MLRKFLATLALIGGAVVAYRLTPFRNPVIGQHLRDTEERRRMMISYEKQQAHMLGEQALGDEVM